MSNIGELIKNSINILSTSNINEIELNENIIYINNNSNIDQIIHLNFLKILKRIYDNNNVEINNEYSDMINNFFNEKLALENYISFNKNGSNYIAITYKNIDEYNKQIKNLEILKNIKDININIIINNSISYIKKENNEVLYKEFNKPNILIYDAFDYDNRSLKYVNENRDFYYILLDLLSIFEFIKTLQSNDYIHRNIYSDNIRYKNNKVYIIDFTTMTEKNKMFDENKIYYLDNKPIQIEKIIYDNLCTNIKNVLKNDKNKKIIKENICSQFNHMNYNYMNDYENFSDTIPTYDSLIYYQKIKDLLFSYEKDKNDKKDKKEFYADRLRHIIDDICKNNNIVVNEDIINQLHFDYINKYAKTYDIYSVHEIIHQILYSKISSNYDDEQKRFLASLANDCFHINENGNNIDNIIEKIINNDKYAENFKKK